MNEYQELFRILKSHLEKYPKIQPQDVVKLIYQSEFGPGHMIKDPVSCRKWLEEEYAQVQPDENVRLIEKTGGKSGDFRYEG